MATEDRHHKSNKFYTLTNEEWTKAWKELKPAELRVLYHLRTLDPFGDRQLDIGVRELAATLGCNAGTVSRALKALDEKGWIDLELVRVNIKLKTQHLPVLSVDNSVVYRQQTQSTDNKLDLYATNSISTQQTRSTDNIQALEPLISKDSRSPNTIHTDQTFSDTYTTKMCVENEQGEQPQKPNDASEALPTQSRRLHTPINPSTEGAAPTPKESSAPPLLHKAQQLGVNLNDPKLKRAIARFSDRVPAAIEALVEKASTVRFPTRFLEKAILEAWKPETQIDLSFSDWFAKAQHQNCGVLGSLQDQGVQWVLDHQGYRYRWDELRLLSWDELRTRLKGADASAYVDLSSVIAGIDCELHRLGWTAEQARSFLENHFGTRHRSRLSDAQLFEWLHLLQAQEGAYCHV